MSGVVRYERVALPLSGGLYRQPARDMEALSALEGVANTVAYEQAQERRSRAKREEKGRRPRR